MVAPSQVEPGPKGERLGSRADQLGWMVIKMMLAWGILTFAVFCYYVEFMRCLSWPLRKLPTDGPIISRTSDDAMGVGLELVVWAGFSLAIPFHVYWVTKFAAPALARERRKALLSGLGVAFLSFVAGFSIALSYLLPMALQAIWHAQRTTMMAPWWTWRDYYYFAAWLCLGTGILCELPVILGVLVRLVFLNHSRLNRLRLFAYLIFFTMAFVGTPGGDRLAILVVVVPFVLVYEAFALVAWLREQRWRVAMSARPRED